MAFETSFCIDDCISPGLEVSFGLEDFGSEDVAESPRVVCGSADIKGIVFVHVIDEARQGKLFFEAQGGIEQLRCVDDEDVCLCFACQLEQLCSCAPPGPTDAAKLPEGDDVDAVFGVGMRGRVLGDDGDGMACGSLGDGLLMENAAVLSRIEDAEVANMEGAETHGCKLGKWDYFQSYHDLRA